MGLEKAIITNTVKQEEIPVMFNPEEYTLSRDINYAQHSIPGLSAPIIQFVNGSLQTLEMELFLDTYEDNRDVRDDTSKITDLMDIDPTTHAPPVLLFTWASLSFICVLARVSQRFIMFRMDGTPVRARLQVTFNEFRNVDLEAKEIKRETADYSKHYVVGQGESMSSIAAHAYGDARMWRPIALHNGVDDPRALPVGMSLLIPPLPFRDPETGEDYPSS